ncbi:thermonuclease family protein [Enterobacter quasiroggenkampii]|uniref:thermonuclease family protein n=1 Tax=Enterobacter TaxID=547 RepID=UPI0012B8F026|nr:thermonuclease family protein [Enterobacter quasiroggenkampii]MCU6322958.1 thermonuclease family protein [Enterobacter quasiroggenkampii]MCU6329767.1 thermonuclease family protein [Enterobacter quasiroggenkampii]MCU6359602.1 thermonuclease family protein [Enterobacter quasiroggenkampii]
MCVRLVSIDATEKNLPFGQRSRQTFSSIVAQCAVSITCRNADFYGPLLGTVWPHMESA